MRGNAFVARTIHPTTADDEFRQCATRCFCFARRDFSTVPWNHRLRHRHEQQRASQHGRSIVANNIIEHSDVEHSIVQECDDELRTGRTCTGRTARARAGAADLTLLDEN
jgi:hypothetical protein